MAGRALTGADELHDAGFAYKQMYTDATWKAKLLTALDARRTALGRS